MKQRGERDRGRQRGIERWKGRIRGIERQGKGGRKKQFSAYFNHL